ncbi:hypothetical protein ALP75_200931 [Pseudomonas syringae pv. actinidiae]|nr:hypothetical protein ALP75_200931 [Pseudomonas syringae pv. actinidiae]
MVPDGSLCMPWVSWLTSSCNASNAPAFAAPPSVSDCMNRFMPLAATSAGTSTLAKVAPIAASCPDASPATGPSGPIAVTMVAIFFSRLLPPSTLIFSDSAATCG